MLGAIIGDIVGSIYELHNHRSKEFAFFGPGVDSPTIASDADEALVTLTYLPGGDRPARVDLLLDGQPPDRIVILPAFGALESRVLHELFVVASAHAVDLARWGHQQPGMPWEHEPGGLNKPAISTPTCERPSPAFVES